MPKAKYVPDKPKSCSYQERYILYYQYILNDELKEFWNIPKYIDEIVLKTKSTSEIDEIIEKHKQDRIDCESDDA